MAAELVDHITCIMCIIERTSSDISDNLLLSPRGHIERQQCKSKEALFCKIFDFFLSFRTWCVTKLFQRMASCTLVFQAGNFTCILTMKSFEGISFKSLLLQGKDLKNTRRRFQKKLERLQQRNPCWGTDCILSVSFLFPRTTIEQLLNHIFDCVLTS